MFESVLGSLAEGAASAFGQSSANRSNRAASREQMDFQERMSNSAWQRGMEDMRKAGLNPVLAGKLGGASAPVGAQASAQNAMTGFSGSTARALEARRLSADIDNLNALNSQIKSQTMLNSANAIKSSAETNILNTTRGKDKFWSSVYEVPNNIINSAKKFMNTTDLRKSHNISNFFNRNLIDPINKTFFNKSGKR